MSAGEAWSSSFASASLDSMRVYDQIMVPRLFEPWADLLLEQLVVTDGEAVLDVACGPGSVTRRAARRVGPSGRVTGCDLRLAMLSLARGKPSPAPDARVEYLECRAEALPVPDAACVVATCQQGLQFFPNRPAALSEMRRALRRGGRAGIAVWCAIEDCPPFAGLAAALGQVLGGEVATAYRNGPWGLADRNELARLAEQAGFINVTVSRHQLPVVFEGGPVQLLETLAAASVATDVAELDDSGQRALLEALEEAVEPLVEAGAVRSEMASHLVLAEV